MEMKSSRFELCISRTYIIGAVITAKINYVIYNFIKTLLIFCPFPV